MSANTDSTFRDAVVLSAVFLKATPLALALALGAHSMSKKAEAKAKADTPTVQQPAILAR